MLLYLLSHFEFKCHTVDIFTPWPLPPTLTNTVKLSLFTNAHSSLLSLAARFHRGCGNHSGYINNGWMFSGQTVYTYIYVCACMYIHIYIHTHTYINTYICTYKNILGSYYLILSIKNESHSSVSVINLVKLSTL